MNTTAGTALNGSKRNVVNLGIPEEYIMCYEDIQGNMFPRVLWSDLEKLYDACWVHMCNILHLDKDFSCVVIAVTDEEHTDAMMSELMNLGYDTGILRTEPLEGVW